MSAHTPGPWCVNDTHGGRYIETQSEDVVAQVFRSKRYLADARLIASAPLMLLELYAAAAQIEALGGDARTQRAAIAKAEGKS